MNSDLELVGEYSQKIVVPSLIEFFLEVAKIESKYIILASSELFIAIILSRYQCECGFFWYSRNVEYSWFSCRDHVKGNHRLCRHFNLIYCRRPLCVARDQIR